MGTRDRLLAPLRRIVSQAPAPQDPTSLALAGLFGPEPPDSARFAPELLARAPLERLQQTVAALRERHGALRAVRPLRELHQLSFAHGTELVWAATDPDGRLTTLVTGPGALLARDGAAGTGAGTVPGPSAAGDDATTDPASGPGPDDTAAVRPAGAPGAGAGTGAAWGCAVAEATTAWKSKSWETQ